MSYTFADSLRAGSERNCSQAVSKRVWNIPFLCVQWKTPDNEQRNCAKNVEFYSKNKFEELVHPVAFTIRTSEHVNHEEEHSFYGYQNTSVTCKKKRTLRSKTVYEGKASHREWYQFLSTRWQKQKNNKTGNAVQRIMYPFGCFPGVWLLYADVSKPSIGSIFKGWI